MSALGRARQYCHDLRRRRLRHYRLDDDYQILFGEEQLMGSWALRSEEALATLVVDRLGSRPGRMRVDRRARHGLTFAVARAAFAASTAVTVAELVPQGVAWADTIVGDWRSRAKAIFAVR